MLSRHALRAVRPAAAQRTIIAPWSAVRNYAAAATAPTATTQNVKPPIAVYGLDGTYATALYTAASKTSSLDGTARALGALGQLCERDGRLAAILSTPTLTEADKGGIVAELLKNLGDGGGTGPAAATVKNFLSTLAANNRLGLLKGVAEKFGQLMAASRGEVEVTVTSAQPLDNKMLSRLETAVAKSQYVGPGKKLKVSNDVNPDLVGGLVVEIGDRTIDLSVSSKLAKMNKLLNDSL